MSDLSPEEGAPQLYCEHMGCPNGCTTRSGMCEACVRELYEGGVKEINRLTAQVQVLEKERTDGHTHGLLLLATVKNLQDEREALKAEVRELMAPATPLQSAPI